MRETTERILPLHNLEHPEDLARNLEEVAEGLARDGWFFLHATVDELMENMILYFDRDLEV